MPEKFSIIIYSTLDSTNDEAKRLADFGCQEFTVITAIEQRSGRGRRGRIWQSVPGNLYLSIILRPHLLSADAACISYIAALAVARSIRAYVKNDVDVRLKWPNDVLVNGKKISGILLEAQSSFNHIVDWVVVGIGLNLVGVPNIVDYPVTALADHSTCPIIRDVVIETLLQNFDEAYRVFTNQGFAMIREAWLDLATGIGQTITVRNQSEAMTGIFCGLDASGAMLLDCGSAGITRVTTGEIFFPVPEGCDAPGY